MPVLAGAVGDVKGSLSSENQLDDKDLRLTRYMYMTSSIIVHLTMLFQILTFGYDLRLSICLISWNRHLNILHFEY